MFIDPDKIESEIVERIGLLIHNNKNNREDVYKSYLLKYGDKVPNFNQIIERVEQRYRPFGWASVVTYVFFVGATCNIVDFFSKPFGDLLNIPLIYILVGLIIFAICACSLPRSFSKEQEIDRKLGFCVSYFSFLLGIVGFIYSQTIKIDQEPTVKDVYILLSEINRSGGMGIPESRAMIKNKNEELVMKNSVTNTSENKNTNSNEDQDKNRFSDQYCTIYIESPIYEMLLWKKYLQSNIFVSNKNLALRYKITALSNKTLRRTVISDNSVNLKGDFGRIEINESGKYTYILEDRSGIGNYEEFSVELTDNFINKSSIKIFISIVGSNQLGTDSRDTIFAGYSRNKIFVKNGDDWLYGNNRADIISGGDGNDLIVGYGGNDYLKGDDGDDIIYGGQGINRMEGGNGNDHLIGGEGANVISGGKGSDTIWIIGTSQSADTILDFNLEEGDKIEISHLTSTNNPNFSIDQLITERRSGRDLFLYFRIKNNFHYDKIVILKNFPHNLQKIIDYRSILYLKN